MAFQCTPLSRGQNRQLQGSVIGEDDFVALARRFIHHTTFPAMQTVSDSAKPKPLTAGVDLKSSCVFRHNSK